MQAGLLNTIIEIYKPQVTVNEFGEQVQEYIKINETKAQVISNSGNRNNSNGEIFHSYNKTFRVRRYVEMNETYHIHWEGKKYRIITIEENRKYNEKNIETELINE